MTETATAYRADTTFDQLAKRNDELETEKAALAEQLDAIRHEIGPNDENFLYQRDEARRERDALAAHVERVQGVANQIRGYTLLGLKPCLNMLLDAIEEPPEASLAHLKAQWQAEVIDSVKRTLPGGRGVAWRLLNDRAAELRRQAEELAR